MERMLTCWRSQKLIAICFLLIAFFTPFAFAQKTPWNFAVSGDSRNCGDVVMPASFGGGLKQSSRSSPASVGKEIFYNRTVERHLMAELLIQPARAGRVIRPIHKKGLANHIAD